MTNNNISKLIIGNLNSYDDKIIQQFDTYISNMMNSIKNPLISKFLMIANIYFNLHTNEGWNSNIVISPPDGINNCVIACYNYNLHTLWIDSEYLADENTFITLFMHEVGHLVMYALYKNNALPYRTDDMKAQKLYFNMAIDVLKGVWSEKNWNVSDIEEIKMKKLLNANEKLSQKVEDLIPDNYFSSFEDSILSFSDSILLKLETGQDILKELIVGVSEFLVNQNIDHENNSNYLLLQDYYNNFIEPDIDHFISQFTLNTCESSQAETCMSI